MRRELPDTTGVRNHADPCGSGARRRRFCHSPSVIDPASPITGSRRTSGMRSRLDRFLPALVLVVCTLSVLIVLEGRSDGGKISTPKPVPALASPTLVFVANAPADPQAVAVRLAGPGAVAYSYAEVCGMKDLRPPKFILSLVGGQRDAVLERARKDPDVRDPVLSVWPCGAGL